MNKLQLELDGKLRLADEQQLRAEQHEKILMSESPDEKDVRWMREEAAREIGEAWGEGIPEEWDMD